MNQRVDAWKILGIALYAFLNRDQIIVVLIWVERVYAQGLETILDETMASAKDY
jgi:hypothetical protein